MININIDDADLTRIQSNTIPLHGDDKATIEALLPHLLLVGANDRPSPAEAVVAARRLVAYRDIQLEEPQYPRQIFEPKPWLVLSLSYFLSPGTGLTSLRT